MFFHWYQIVANPPAYEAPVWATGFSALVPVPKAWPIMTHHGRLRSPRKYPPLVRIFRAIHSPKAVMPAK
jgi:hypothetical protein